MAIVEMIPLKRMEVEEFAKYPKLGRFTVRDNDKLIAIGMVTKVFN